jgi:hypothetical protein
MSEGIEGIPQTAEQETKGTKEDKEARAAQEAAGVEQTGVSGRPRETPRTQYADTDFANPGPPSAPDRGSLRARHLRCHR